MSTPTTRGVLAWLSILALGTGCCGSGGEAGPSLETVKLELPAVDAATGIQASWFLAVPRSLEMSGDELEACAAGDVAGIPLEFALVEAGQDGIALGGQPVVSLVQGKPVPAVKSGTLIEPLYDALCELRDRSTAAALLGCRPWTNGAAQLPTGLGERDQPPLLLAVDDNLPVKTLARIMFSAGMAGFMDMALWVEDPTPAALGSGQDAAVSEETLVFLVEEAGVHWNHFLDEPSRSLDGIAESPVALADLPGSLRADIDLGAPPSAILVIGEGSTGAHVRTQDTLAQLGIHCSVYTLGIGGPDQAEPGSDGTSAPRTRRLEWDATLAALPLFLPPILPPGTVGPYPLTALTGHTCPIWADKTVEGESSSGGLENLPGVALARSPGEVGLAEEDND